MAKYRDERGNTVAAEDGARLLWYAAGNRCGYWTDDWSKLKTTGGGIPCCPCCGIVGMQTTAHSWFGGAQQFERDGHTRYVEFLKQSKEKCFADDSTYKGFMPFYEQWLGEQAEEN